MRTKFKQQFTELHTHANLLVCLAPCRHRTWVCEAPTDAHHWGRQDLKDAKFEMGNQQKELEAKSVSQLLLLMPRRSLKLAEAAVRVLWDLLLFWAVSFLPLFSVRDIVPKCHGGGETQTGCFCCMILAVTQQQAKRSKTTTLLSCTTLQLAPTWKACSMCKAQPLWQPLHAECFSFKMPFVS